jgi:hypothetical protein
MMRLLLNAMVLIAASVTAGASLAAMSTVNPAFSQNLDARPRGWYCFCARYSYSNCRPAACRPAFHIRYKKGRGLPIDRVMVALFDARGRLTIQYEAPAIVYFQRGLADFEAMVQACDSHKENGQQKGGFHVKPPFSPPSVSAISP